jgi:menaquinone-dependent protoporphyrinogen IX oxidase
VDKLISYDAIILGAPMMMGWHPGMVNFIQKRQTTLKNVPTAYFITAINLTNTGETRLRDIPIFIDKNFARPPRKASRLSPKERHTSIAGYLAPIFSDIPAITPERIAFFGGNLNLRRLRWWQIFLVTFVIRAKPGDRRNPVAIREWASGLPAMVN